MPDDRQDLVLPKAQPSRVGPRRWLVRLVLALVVVPVTGLLALFAASMTGWGVETEPIAQLQRALPLLLASGAAGAVCGAALGFALAGPRLRVVVTLVVLGLVPAVVAGTAILTTSY